MRAARLHAFGGPITTEEIAEPSADTGELLVDLLYAAVNPLDVWTCNGNFAAITPLPHTPGAEGLGTIGPVTVLVSGGGIGISRQGTYAQRISVPATSVTEVPDDIDAKQAATMGVAGVTAWRCVHDKGAVTADDVVLVTGATGGVGSLVVQLACAAGAVVLGQTSSDRKTDAIEKLGAKPVLSADGAGLAKALAGRVPTVVIDGLGGDFIPAIIEALAPNGRLVNYGTSASTAATIDMRVLYRKGITVFGYTGLLLTDVKPTFDALFAAVRSGALVSTIDDVVPLGGAGAAHQRILSKQVGGKLLLDVNV